MASVSYLAVVARCDAIRPKRAMGNLTQGCATLDEARAWAIRAYESMTGLRVWTVFEISGRDAVAVETGSVKADPGWRELAIAGIKDRVRPVLEQLRLALIQGGPEAAYDDAGNAKADLWAQIFTAVKKGIEEEAEEAIKGRMSAEFPDDPQPGEVLVYPCVAGKSISQQFAGGVPDSRRDHHQMGFGGAPPLNQGQGVRVAVLATGCRRTHPMLDGDVAEVIDATGIGGGSADPHGFGTAICSMLISQHPKDQPIGTARRVKVVPVQVMHASQGYGTDEWVARGVDACMGLGVDVVLMPFAGPDPMPRTEQAVKRIILNGIVVIAAGGDVRPGHEGGYYPASYPEVYAVGAVDGVGHLTAFSNDAVYIDLLASGEAQVAAGSGDSVDLVSGTGPAAAHVAAAVALIITRWREVQHTEPSRDDTFKLLNATKRYLGDDGATPFSAPGIIDVGAALSQIIPPAVEMTADQVVSKWNGDVWKGATIHHLATTEHINPATLDVLLAWMRDDESDRLLLCKPLTPPAGGVAG